MDQDWGHPHLLLWYVSGDLDPSQARETEEHLAHCRDCTAEAKALASMLQNLKNSVDGELTDFTADSVSQFPPVFSRPEPPSVRELPPISWWRRSSPALIASLATVTILLITVPAFVRTIGDTAVESNVREVQPVILAPTQRGAGNAKVLTGEGPWAISVVLPFGAPAGVYDMRIEAVDLPARPVMTASLPADSEGRLSVVVESLPQPGRFVMSVRSRQSAAATPYVYAFQTVAGATSGA